jgi:hypothetical protein
MIKNMKQRIVISFLIIIGFTACEDYLDKAPELGLTEDDVFAEFESARGFLDQNYNMLEDFHNWDSQNITNYNMTSLSDETASITDYQGGQSILPLNAGQWLGESNKGEVGWDGCCGTRSPILGRAFTGLRITNKVIANAEKISDISQEDLDGLLGQAYFLRAWWYFQIIQRWGGMPIFDRVFNPIDDMDLERLTYQESSEWLIEGLDKAIGLLPDTWNDAEYGRATKGAALGLKSMAALYASSPLMKNGLNSIVNNGYDMAWSERTAEYANDAIQYVKNGTGGHRYRLMTGDEYEHIFYHEAYASDEEIWFKGDVGRRSVRDMRSLYIPRRINNDGGQGQSAMNFSNPTQNIVDKFETLDGYPISDPASGYDSQLPFENRDPRLTNNIFLPGEQWGVNGGNKPLYLETYVGGKDYRQAQNVNITSSRMISGYANKKYMWPGANGYTKDYSKYNYNMDYIRVSQLYLDFAEAMNEAYGPNTDPKGFGMTAVIAINIIRNRVGMPDILSQFTGSKEAFRERIRNERAVELMFEHPHRWNDLRRWMIAEEVFEHPIKGIRAYPEQQNEPTDFRYEVIDLTPELRVFETRNYWYPVAKDDVENLFNFQQNPGW